MMTPTVDRMVGAGLCFGDHDCAGRTQTRDCGGIAAWPSPGACLLFSFADEPGGIDPVFYRDRPSEETADR